jgi:hypothetical protein
MTRCLNKRGQRHGQGSSDRVQRWSARRFPLPWTVETQDACFVVRDRDGQALAHVYFEEGAGSAIGGKII